jgi:hypothetical protein
MRKVTALLLATTVGLLASVHVAGAETANDKVKQKMFNPQPDPPGVQGKVNPATSPSKRKHARGEKGIIVVNNKPVGKSGVGRAGQKSIPPIPTGSGQKASFGGDGSQKGIIVINNKPGSGDQKGLIPIGGGKTGQQSRR